MLYMTGDGISIVILESANLEELKKGRPAKTPDGKILICWTPDPVWLADKLMDSGGDAAVIAKLIDESCKRPEKSRPRPKHEPYLKSFPEGSENG